jgi:hypothetical protein
LASNKCSPPLHGHSSGRSQRPAATGLASTYAIAFRRWSSSRTTVEEKRSPKRWPCRSCRRLNSCACVPFMRCIPAESDVSMQSTMKWRCVSSRHHAITRHCRSTISRAKSPSRKSRS